MTTIALSPEILKANKDGIEFYTIQSTGESGMSMSGLAKACGVTHQSISLLVKGLARKSPSDILEPFACKSLEDFVLASNSSFNNVTILKDIFCGAVLTHYAKAGRIEAANNVCRFAAAGIRTFIHSQTGWKPQETSNKLPTDFVESLEMLLAAEKEKKALATANKELQIATTELQVINAELAPKAEAAEVFLESNRNLTFQEAAQLLAIPGIGRDNLFKALIELKLLINTAHPYQRFIEQGIFFVKEIPTNVGFRRQILITPKGMGYILPLLKEHGKKSSKVADSFRLTKRDN